MTTRYLTTDTDDSTSIWVDAPISIADGGTGAGTQADALTAILGGVPLSIANGGTNSATQSAALAAMLGSSAVPIANGGTGSTATPLQAGDLWYSADGSTITFLRAPDPTATIVSRVLTLTSNGVINSLAWVGS